MSFRFGEAPDEYVEAMMELERLLEGKVNMFAASLGMTIMINVVMNEAPGRDLAKADKLIDEYAAKLKEGYRVLTASALN